jgi:hypothetical protein
VRRLKCTKLTGAVSLIAAFTTSALTLWMLGFPDRALGRTHLRHGHSCPVATADFENAVVAEVASRRSAGGLSGT